MKRIILTRTSKTDKVITGTLSVVADGITTFVGRAIERTAVSFPPGTYRVVREYSPKFGAMLWELKGVAGRSEIKIHVANYANQLDGCIGLGTAHQDIDGDGVTDLAESRKALSKFHYAMNRDIEATITVVEAYE